MYSVRVAAACGMPPPVNPSCVPWHLGCTATPYARLAINVEATSVYHVPLMEWLAQTPDLQRWQPTWYVLNPKVVQKFREADVARGNPIGPMQL
jgi:hypothetical protein